MEDYGLVIKRSEDDFVVFVDENQYYSGYNVVPKTVDPENAYNIEDVKAYCESHPEKVVTEHPLESQIETIEKINEEQMQLDAVNKQLFDRMVQKVFNPDIGTQEEYIPTTEELLAKKAQLEQSIAQLKQSLN